MNNLFKDGDYVLLSDCEAYDVKHRLEPKTTMWVVARKMEGGEPDRAYMSIGEYDNCVGINNGDAGVWDVADNEVINQLTVEDVLSRGEPEVKWKPSAGDTIMVGNTPKFKYQYIGLNSTGSAVCESLQEKNLGEIKCFHLRDIKLYDNKRERTINKAFEAIPVYIFDKKDVISELYDLGLLRDETIKGDTK